VSTDGLVEFLRARLDEDEASFRAIRHGGFTMPRWVVKGLGRSGAWYEVVAEDETLHDGEVDLDDEPAFLVRNGRGEHEFITRFNPARVLAEVEAKRRITARHSARLIEGRDGDGVEREAYFCSHDDDPWPCDDLRDFALPYAGHSDYRQEWKP
jgi:hypothetical protein